jgi:hypothetical protein
MTSMHGYDAPVIPQEEFRNSFGLMDEVPINSHWSEDEQSEAGRSIPVRKSILSWKERGIRRCRSLRRYIQSLARRFRWRVRR